MGFGFCVVFLLKGGLIWRVCVGGRSCLLLACCWFCVSVEGKPYSWDGGILCTYVRVAFGRFNLWDCFELCCIYICMNEKCIKCRLYIFDNKKEKKNTPDLV